MENKQVINNFYQQLTGTSPDNLSYLHEDIQWSAAHPVNDLRGHEQFFSDYWNPIKKALPDVEYKPFIMLEGEYRGQDWVNSTGYFVGTFENPLFDIPATGKTLYLRYGELIRIHEDKIMECYIIPDFLDAMIQAGVNPTRASLGHDGLVMPPTSMDGLTLSSSNKEETTKSFKLVEAMHAGLARYDGESLLSMDQEKYWHPDFMWYGPAGIGTTRGMDGFRQHHQGPFLTGFPDRSVDSSVSFIAEDHYVAMGGWPHMSATHSGEGWMGLPPSGKNLSIRVMDFWRREDDLLRENWVSIDIIHFLLQMGHDVFAQMRELVTEKHQN